MTTFFNQFNGSSKPVKPTQLLSTPRLASHKHLREEFRSGDSPVEATDGCSPRSAIHQKRKRFKPDLTTSKHRVCHRDSEDSQSNSCPYSPTLDLQAAPQNLVQATTQCTGDEEEGAGSGEDDGDDSDGPNSFQLQENSIGNQCSENIAPDKPIGQDIGGKDLDETSSIGSKTTPTLTPSASVDKPPPIESKIKLKAERKKNSLDFVSLEALVTGQGFSILSKKPSGITLRCPEGHKVPIKPKDNLHSLRCKKCDKKLAKCAEYANSNNGKVKNTHYEPTIIFECEKGHEWRIKYCKYMFTRWCPQCEKSKREEKKKTIEEESEKLRKENAAEQNAKLEEARLKMLEEEQARYNNYQSWFYQWPHHYIYSQAMLTDESINKLAQELALKYVRDNKYSYSVDIGDIFLLYKILITSQEMLLAKLIIIPRAELCSFYRKYAVKLHPDKNKHPRANEAFQKFTECYKFCCSHPSVLIANS